MKEVVNVLREEVSSVTQEMCWVNTGVDDVLDLLTLLSNSCCFDENKSMHSMLNMVIEKLGEVKESNVISVMERLEMLCNKLESLCIEADKPKRTRTVKKDTQGEVKKPATTRKRQVKPKEVVKKETEGTDNKVETVES